MADSATKLGKELRHLRQLSGASLRAVAGDMGLSAAYMLKLENGDVSAPSPHTLRKLARHYEVSYLALMSMAGYATTDDAAEVPVREREESGVLADALQRERLSSQEAYALAAMLSSMRANSDTP